MAVVAEIEVAAEEFHVGRVLTADLEVEVSVEPVVPTAGQIVPYVWVDGPDVDTFAGHVSEGNVVDAVVELDSADGLTLFRIDWNAPSDCLLEGLRECEAMVLDARGGDQWCFRARFPSREELSAFHDYCTQRDVSLSLVRVRSGESTSLDRLELTPEQRRALELATEQGYFSVPRETTLSELADELGISSQAVSERIRRGAGTTLQSVIGDDHRE
ncbi:helix-turn-helix domain-containing protein [Natrialbaceae archaeon A-gly3]